MLARPDRNFSQALYPTDLDSLKNVFDALCRDGDVLPGSEDACEIAAELVRLFQAGMTDEMALKVAVRARRQALAHRTG